MAAWTLAEAQTTLAEYQAAQSKVLDGQAYSIAGRAMTRADLTAILDGIKFWAGEVAKLERSSGGGMRVRTGVPL